MLSIFVLFCLYQLSWLVPVIVGYVLTYTLVQPALQYLGTALVLKLSVQKAVLTSNILRIAFAGALFSLEGPSVAGYALLALTAVLDAASFWIYYLAWDVHFSDLQSQNRFGQTDFSRFRGDGFGQFPGPFGRRAAGSKSRVRGKPAIAGILLLFSITPLLLIKQRNLAGVQSRSVRSAPSPA